MPLILYSAAVVCPMSGPPLAGGGVLVEGGLIQAIGPAAALRAHAATEHAIDGALLPGLVNAHTHLEHADALPVEPPASWPSWWKDLDSRLRGWDADRWSRSAHRGVQAALRGGATAVGDVVARGPGVPAAGGAGLTGDSWIELSHADWGHHDEVLAGLDAALDLPPHGRRLGLAARSPAALGTGVLQALAALAARRDAPLRVPAGESLAEVEAVRQGNGPLAALARGRGLDFEWLDAGTGLTPVRYLDACGVLRPGASLAHGVWVDPDEAALLAERGVSVALCPRAAEVLGTGQAPLEHYAAAGTALALGTADAVCPDLDLLQEAAAWVRLASRRGLRAWPGPGGPLPLAEQAIRLLTIDGAAAMGWGGQAGVLEQGRRADLVGVAMPTTAETVYRDLVTRGRGRLVLTVVGGLRKARRTSPEQDWIPIDRQEWRA